MHHAFHKRPGWAETLPSLLSLRGTFWCLSSGLSSLILEGAAHDFMTLCPCLSAETPTSLKVGTECPVTLDTECPSTAGMSVPLYVLTAVGQMLQPTDECSGGNDHEGLTTLSPP